MNSPRERVGTCEGLTGLCVGEFSAPLTVTWQDESATRESCRTEKTIGVYGSETGWSYSGLMRVFG